MKPVYNSRDKLLRHMLNMHVRRIVSFTVGFIALALLVGAEIALISVIWREDISLLAVALVGILTAISAPFIWRLAKVITNRLLLPEIIHYKRVIRRPLLVHERQRELDAMKEQFINTASHELRTPLTTVQGYIELLCDHHDMLTSETQVEFLQKARVGCDELNLMVSNILDANLVREDVGQVHLYPILLSVAVLHILEMLNATIQGEKRSVTVYIDSNLAVCADDLRLRQILLNLISNALKYSASGTGIEISAVRDNMEVQISVRDYGLGVPPEKQQQLFDRFTRLERDLNSPVRGAGLGLYICERFVAAMGGRIWVESSGVPGEGCVFTFVLQYAVMDQAQQVEAVELPV
jgi:signal transduction histidine kinase